MANINWDQLVKDAGDITPVPPGKVDAVITKCEAKDSSNGKPMWACTFRVQNGPQAGKTFYNNFVLSMDNPKALQAFFINMQQFGLSQDQIRGLGQDPTRLAQALVGRQAIIQISHREYQGQMRENVDRVEKHPAGPVAAQGAGGGTIAPAPAQQQYAASTPPATPQPPAQAPAPAQIPQPQTAPPVPSPAPAAPPVQAAPQPVPSGAGAPPLPF